MMLNSTTVAAVSVVCVGFVAFWSNPRRKINQLFFTIAVHVAAWLLTLNFAVTGNQGDGLFWLKLACSVGGVLPLHIWLVQGAIESGASTFNTQWGYLDWGWLAVSLGLAVVPFTEIFIPSHSSPEHRIRGWGVNAYIFFAIVLYLVIVYDAIRTVKKLTGGQRLELHIWMSGGCITAISVLALWIANELTKNTIYILVQPPIVLLFYAGTAFAITNYRILDTRQVLLWAVEKLILVCTVATVAYGLDRLLEQFLPKPFDFLGATALTLWCAVALNGWLNQKFHFYPEASTARQLAYDVSRKESRVEALEKSFLGILKGWSQSDSAVLLSGDDAVLSGGGHEVRGETIPLSALRELRWVTPERLSRERSTPGRIALQAFLRDHDLGVMVVSEQASLFTLAGLGVVPSRRPFTYPQVTQLVELVAIMSNALERAHLSVKAKHAEQLATVGLLGASVAHEIRNPLVSIKTFVQHLPDHYQDPIFREKFFTLIGAEVTRIDQLTEQLLDLASPRAYVATEISVNEVLSSTVELVAPKAQDKDVQFILECEAKPDVIYFDASAAKQVLLNLCFNAIQALEGVTGSRWVKVSTASHGKHIEVIIEDSGPGIAPEIRSRLFQPFQTTKSTGFGLGLAICSNILTSLNANISVDPPVAGRGAVFRIVFPCQAS